MNISPFYELRSRLYASAASGCGALNEDFRLKRAVEAFEPLAGANKAFMKLYTDCGRLLESKSPADILPDCIALADALAVTQGSFSEICETAPSEIKTEMKTLPVQYSALSELREKIEKCSPKLAELSEDEIRLLSDVRVLSSFIKASERGNTYLDSLAEIMAEKWGQALVPMLKNAVPLTDEKAAGTRIEYIYMAAGESENDYYVSLATDTAVPQNIRIAAIKAMENSPENGDILLDIYNTSKGKVKNAALTAVLKLGLPESDEIIGKLIGKARGDHDDYIMVSSCETAEKFVREQIMETSKALRSKNRSPITPLENTFPLLSNKSGIADCFIEAAEISRLWGGEDGGGDYYVTHRIAILNDVLIQNLKNKDNEKFRRLITELYEKAPDDFIFAYFFMRFIDDPEGSIKELYKASDKQHSLVSRFLMNIGYSFTRGKYYTPYFFSYDRTDRSKPQKAFLFESFPDTVLEFMLGFSDIDYYAAYENISFSLKKFVSHCAPYDRERIKNAVLETVFRISEKSPYYMSIELVAEYCPEAMGYRCRGIVSRYIMDKLMKNDVTGCSVINRLPLSDSEKIEELTELLNRVCAAKGNFTENTRNRILSDIRAEINKLVKG